MRGRSPTTKRPIVALFGALDALKAAGVALTSNVRVLVDGEEESGSLGLSRALPQYRTGRRPICSCCSTIRSIRAGGPLSFSVPEARSAWSSPPTVPRSVSTAATTATGCRTRAHGWFDFWRR